MTGCFGGHTATRGVPLSEAMAAAVAGDTSERTHVPADHDSGASIGDTQPPIITTEAAPETLPRRRIEPDYFTVVSFSIEEVLPIANDIRNMTRLELMPVGIQDAENFAGLVFGGGNVEFNSGSLPGRALSDTFLLDIGLVGRHYFTPPKTFVSPYFTGGVYAQALCWDYRTPLNYNGDIIHSDFILGGGGFIGFGLSVARKEYVGIFCEARLGMTLYDDATMQGFYNDMFEGYAYVSMRAGVSIQF
ncbi:MAG: hypothetical protein QM813_26015 [Verrucomicrobiota bacterium]